MRSLFSGFTTRGRAFVAAGVAAAVFGLMLGQRTLLSIGGLLVLLPLLSLLAAGRARYRIRCARQITPPRIPAGQAAGIAIQLHNVSRLPTGLLLAEDTVPYSLGTRPRFILDRIEPGGTRSLTYPLQSDTRGKFSIGPLHVHVADTFGLVRIGSEAAAPGTLVVTPAITPLPRTSLAGTWLGEGGTLVLVRVRGRRGRLDRGPPGAGRHRRGVRHRRGPGRRAPGVRGCAARHAGRRHPLPVRGPVRRAGADTAGQQRPARRHPRQHVA